MLNCGGAGIAAVDRQATVVRLAPVEGRATPSPSLGLIAFSPPAGTTAMHVPVVPNRRVVVGRSVAPPVDMHAALSLTPFVGATARLDAVLVLVTVPFPKAPRTSSALVRFLRPSCIVLTRVSVPSCAASVRPPTSLDMPVPHPLPPSRFRVTTPCVTLS